MFSIFIASTGNQAGQTLIAWTIVRLLKDKGLKIGFLKPQGDRPVHLDGCQIMDCDALLMSEILDLKEPPETICPRMLVRATGGHLEKGKGSEILERIKGSFHEISKGKDILIIMGSQEVFYDKASWGIPESKVIEALNAKVILIHRYEKESSTIYSLLSIHSFLGDMLKGVVINRIPPESLPIMKERILPLLKEKGIRIPVVIPEDPLLGSTRLQKLIERLDGRVLCCKDKVENLVEHYTIGITYLNKSLDIFKRVYNKIMLIGIPPPSICGIVLTGGRLPSKMIIQRAESAGIPLILVREDTFATLDRLQKATMPLSPGDEFKVDRLMEMVGKEGIEGLLKAFIPG